MNYNKWSPSMKASVWISFLIMVISIFIFLTNYPIILLSVILIISLAFLWRLLKREFEKNP